MRRRQIMILVPVAALACAGGACAGEEPDSLDGFDAALYAAVDEPAECPEKAPNAYFVGEGCPTICAPDTGLTAGQAAALVDAAGAKCALAEEPKLVCKQACFAAAGVECVTGPDGCTEKKPPPAPGCCATDADCGSGVCVGGEGGKGSCETEAPLGKCWIDGDCHDGQVCEGAATCPCDMDCFAVFPGTCKPFVEGCCEKDEDCGAGKLCIPSGEAMGQCADPAPDGECWSAADCDAGETCEGAGTCPCFADCDYFGPGTCSGGDTPACCLADGKPSSECADEGGLCWSDDDCGADATCKGAVVCPCGEPCPGGPEAGTCAGFPGCCATDDDCTGGEVCAGEPGGPWMCEPAPEPGKCWKGSDCEEGFECAGAAPCPCNEVCVAHMAGLCKPEGLVCCSADDDCGDGNVCVAGGGGKGICAPVPPEGKCWTDADCEGGAFCQDPVVCPCDVLCGLEPKPGTCIPEPGGPGAPCTIDADCASGYCVEGPGGGLVCTYLCIEECPPGWECKPMVLAGSDIVWVCLAALPPGCCATDADCGEGAVCAGGSCEMAPLAGQCWDDGDCASGGECIGEMTCPCEMLCFAVAPGKCVYGGEGCCATDADCGDPKSVCVATGDGKGACELAPAEGKCWTDGGCPAGQLCEGALTCPCDWDCTTVEPGTCTSLKAGCCTKDADCDAGEVCTVPAGEVGTCQPAAGAGKCWKQSDCQKAEVCTGIQMCGCDALCKNIAPGTCGAPACKGEVVCAMAAPDCEYPLVPVPKGGCWGCGYPETCTCSDGPLVCAAMPPDCQPGEELAVQGGCWACVSPMTCK